MRTTHLKGSKDRDVVLLQHTRRQHGGQVEEQVRVLLKLVRQRILEGRLKVRSGSRGHSIPPLGITPVVIVDCITRQLSEFGHTARPISFV